MGGHVTRPEAASGRWLPPAVPASVRLIERLGSSSGRIFFCVALALALHVPLMPFARVLTLGFFDFLFDETEESAEDAVVPLDLEVEDGEGGDEELIERREAVEIATPDPEGEGVRDAGVDAAVGVDDGGLDGGLAISDAGPDGGPPDAGAPDAGPDAGLPPDREPIAKNDAIQKLSKNPNNVQIVLIGSRLREHPVGSKMGSLLPGLKQWEPFFKDSGIDPVVDIDVMVITGPQIRKSDDVIAIMKFNIAMDKVEATIEDLVKKGGGEGKRLEGTPVPAWRGTTDGASRLFAVLKEKRLLYILPWPKKGKADKKLSAEEWEKEQDKRVAGHLARIKVAKFPDYSAEKYAIDAYMIQPYKLVSKTGEIDLGPVNIQLIPQELTSMRMRVVPNGGAADVTITFQAKNDAGAKDAVGDLKSAWPLFQLGAKVEIGMELPDLEWETSTDLVVAKGKLEQDVLQQVFDLGKKYADEVKKRKK